MVQFMSVALLRSELEFVPAGPSKVLWHFRNNNFALMYPYRHKKFLITTSHTARIYHRMLERRDPLWDPVSLLC